jgi:WD40-like Beta Propeller Repeat
LLALVVVPTKVVDRREPPFTVWGLSESLTGRRLSWLIVGRGSRRSAGSCSSRACSSRGGPSPPQRSRWACSDGSNLAFNEAVGWIVGVDGSGLTPLDGRDADWSPTGSRFAFAAGGIWVMNADGSGSHQVAPFGHDPVWSPDGSRIAYINDGSLYVMDLDSTHVGNLGTVEPPRRHTAVVWNPLPPSASGGG